MATAIWTIVTCLFLVAHIYFTICGEDSLAVLLKYNFFGILYLTSFGCLGHFFPSNENIAGWFCFAIVILSMLVFIAFKFDSYINETLLDYEFIKRYFKVNEDGSRISYKLFEQMYLLYPEKFHFSDYGWCYRTEAFSLSFLGYIRALHLIGKNKTKIKNAKHRQEYQNLITAMQQDLEKAMLAAQKEKEQAHQQILDAAEEYQNLLSKFNK